MERARASAAVACHIDPLQQAIAVNVGEENGGDAGISKRLPIPPASV